MEFQVNKGSEFPIYQQLKEQIKYFLLSGVLQPGTQVPPPKDLASYLQINRNTVIAAYKELEKEGLLITKHGQGTYISPEIPPMPDEERKQALISLVRETLNKAVELGFSVEDLFTVVFNQAVLGLDQPPQKGLQALLVECNQADVQYFREELQRELNIELHGCLLEELPENVQDDKVVKADFVVTTFFHIEDVKAILEPLGKEVIAFMAAPHLHTFMRIAQLPPGSAVGVICGSEAGSLNMRKALEGAGIQHVTLDNSGLDDKEGLEKMLKRVDWVVASRVVMDAVKSVVPAGVQVMEFYNVVDKAGLQMLKQYVDNKRKTAGQNNNE